MTWNDSLSSIYTVATEGDSSRACTTWLHRRRVNLTLIEPNHCVNIRIEFLKAETTTQARRFTRTTIIITALIRLASLLLPGSNVDTEHQLVIKQCTKAHSLQLS